MNKNVLFPFFLVVILSARVPSSRTNTETSTTVPATANRLYIVIPTTKTPASPIAPPTANPLDTAVPTTATPVSASQPAMLELGEPFWLGRGNIQDAVFLSGAKHVASEYSLAVGFLQTIDIITEAD